MHKTELSSPPATADVAANMNHLHTETPSFRAPVLPERLMQGRYKLGEVIKTLSALGGENARLMEAKLILAVHRRVLPVYLPGQRARYRYEDLDANDQVSFVVMDREEVYSDDLNDWLDREEPRIAYRFPPPMSGKAESNATIGQPDYLQKPMPRQRYQESAILRALRDLGHDPKRLPPNNPGRPGVKSSVRAMLKAQPEFTGKSKFDKAWDRLRADKEIADA